MESNNLEISVYRPDTLTRIGLITAWVSLTWQENYAKHGMMQLEVFADPAISRLLQSGNCCTLTGRNAMMIVRNIKLKDKKLVVTGYTADKLFYERVFVETIPAGTNIEQKTREMIAGMQPWSRLNLGDAAGLEDVTTDDVDATTIGDGIAGMIKDADMGFRVRHDRENKLLVPELYKPAARGMKYSPLYGNVGDVQLTIDDIDTRNVDVVYGEEPEEGETRMIVTVGDGEAAGENRRELYVSADDVHREEDESDDAYRARLIERGEEELKNHQMRQTFALAVKDERADLGDIISASLPEMGVRLSVRIMGVKITAQRGKISRELMYGDPFGIRRY